MNIDDLTKKYSFKFDSNGNEPLTVVVIIGESMRGSTVSEKNMPLIHDRKNCSNQASCYIITASYFML